MFNVFLFRLCQLHLIGAFGYSRNEMSVTEGDSVTLHSGVTELRTGEITWTFVSENSPIALINRAYAAFCTMDVPDGRFRDRLKLDNNTGSLTIANITSEHAGVYEALIHIDKASSKRFTVSVCGESRSFLLSFILFNHFSICIYLRKRKFNTIYILNSAIEIKMTFHIVMFKYCNSTNDKINKINCSCIKYVLSKMKQKGPYFKHSYFSLFSLFPAHLPAPVLIRNSSQCSSSQCNCSVVCSVVNVSAASLSWYKGNSLLSSIRASDLSISLSLALEVEYEDNNTYSCVINNTISNQTTHLDINTLCQPCSGSAFWKVFISTAVVGSLLTVAAVWIIRIYNNQTKTEQKVETGEEGITYAETTFFKRNARNSEVNEEDQVEYGKLVMR